MSPETPSDNGTEPRTESRQERMPAADGLALWRRYRRTGERALRDRLVLSYAPLVKYIVFKKVRQLPARWRWRTSSRAGWRP